MTGEERQTSVMRSDQFSESAMVSSEWFLDRFKHVRVQEQGSLLRGILNIRLISDLTQGRQELRSGLHSHGQMKSGFRGVGFRADTFRSAGRYARI